MGKPRENINILRFVVGVFLVWKLIITFVAFLGFSFLPSSLPGDRFKLANYAGEFWMRWGNWDGGHFRGIAESGYLLPFQVVFFPFYPLLIKALTFFQIPPIWAGVIISNFAIIGALFFLYKLVVLDFDEGIARRVIFLLLAFPTAFYFNAVYSESLFLSLTVSAIYFARKKVWSWAFILAGLSAATRLVGLIVILIVICEFYFKLKGKHDLKFFWSEFLNRISVYLISLAFISSFIQRFLNDKKMYIEAGFLNLLSVLSTALSAVLILFFVVKLFFKQFYFRRILSKPTLYMIFSFMPFLGFCYFLYLTQNDFFAFITQETYWKREITLPWNSLVNCFKDLVFYSGGELRSYSQKLVEFLFFIFLFTALFSSYKRLRLTYTLYFALSLIIPLTSGTLQAIHRYGLLIFPLFIILALTLNERIFQVWMYFSLTLLGLFTVLFINGYWVS